MSLFTCTKCGKCQPVASFHKRSSSKRGHDSWCKDCKSIYRKQYFLNNQEKETTRGRVKAWKDLGININFEVYRRLCVQLNNQCQICQSASTTLHVYHNHETGKVRGLICGSCNRALGLFKESQTILNNAIKYLNDPPLYNS